MHLQPLAYLDPAFLESEEARPLRILAEYLEPLGRFKAQNIQTPLTQRLALEYETRDDEFGEQLMRSVPAAQPLTADQFFRTVLGDILEKGTEAPCPTSPCSPLCRPSAPANTIVELHDWVFGPFVPGPIALHNPVRRASHFRSLGMVCWNLRGSDLVADVLPYNRLAAAFSDDGERVRAPWGVRIMSSSLSSLVRLLGEDPHSLRAVIPVYMPEDIGVASKDVPCLLALSVTLRRQSLYLSATFRSLNAYGVLPYDHALLVVLAEILRAHFRLATACLSYHAVSVHIPADDAAIATKAVRAADVSGIDPPANDDPYRLPDGDIFEQLRLLARYEPEFRSRYGAGGDARSLLPELPDADASWAAALLRDLDTAFRSEHVSAHTR